MAKAKKIANLDEWGRSAARKRYAAGGVADSGNRGVADLISEREAAQQARDAAAARVSNAVLRTRTYNETMPYYSRKEENADEEE